MLRSHGPLSLWILFILIALFSIPAGMAQAGSNFSGSALLESGRFHPHVDMERQTLLSPYPAKSGNALSASNRRPQATGEITCGSDWGATQRFDSLHSVAYGAGLYVAVGDDGAIQTSPDGITWTRRTSGVIDRLQGVTWGGNQFVAVGGNDGHPPSQGVILTSPDGVTWTQRTSDVTANLHGVAWGGNQFVAVGWGGTILTSPDGVIWTSRASGGFTDLNDVIWGDSQFVAVGDGGTGGGSILTSPDGVIWTPRASGDTLFF